MERMTFMPWSHVCPIMALKGERSPTTKNYTFWVTGPTWTSNTTSPREIVDASLNSDNIRLGFSKTKGESLICLYADICKRLVELPESTKILLTSKSPIPNVRIKASSCGWSTRLGLTRGKVIIPSIGCMLLLGKLYWMELICSLTETAQSNLCLFRLELYFSSITPPWM